MLPNPAILSHLNDQRLRDLRAETARARLAAVAAATNPSLAPAPSRPPAVFRLLRVAVAAFAAAPARAPFATSPSGTSRP